MAALRAVLGAALAAALAGAAPAAASPPPRNVSVLLEPGSGRLRVLPGRLPAAVAWASLDDRIPDVGYGRAGPGCPGRGTGRAGGSHGAERERGAGGGLGGAVAGGAPRVPPVPLSHPCPCPRSWAFLEVTTNASYSDSLQAYAAGLAEAAVSEQVRGDPSEIGVPRGTTRSLPSPPADPAGDAAAVSPS